jgi:transcriptional regulator with XRE-family HTH domain
MNEELIFNQIRQALSTGASLRGIAERVGLSHSTLSRILRGQRQPSTGTLSRLNEAIPKKSAGIILVVLLVTAFVIWLFFKLMRPPINTQKKDGFS